MSPPRPRNPKRPLAPAAHAPTEPPKTDSAKVLKLSQPESNENGNESKAPVNDLPSSPSLFRYRREDQQQRLQTQLLELLKAKHDQAFKTKLLEIQEDSRKEEFPPIDLDAILWRNCSSSWTSNRGLHPKSPLYFALQSENEEIVRVIVGTLHTLGCSLEYLLIQLTLNIARSGLPVEILEKFLDTYLDEDTYPDFHHKDFWHDTFYDENADFPQHDQKLACLARHLIIVGCLDAFLIDHVLILFSGRYTLPKIKSWLESIFSALDKIDLELFFDFLADENILAGKGNFLPPLNQAFIEEIQEWLAQDPRYHKLFQSAFLTSIKHLSRDSFADLSEDDDFFGPELKSEPKDQPQDKIEQFICDLGQEIYRNSLYGYDHLRLIQEQFAPLGERQVSKRLIGLIKEALVTKGQLSTAAQGKTIQQRILEKSVDDFSPKQIPEVGLEIVLIQFYQTKFSRLSAQEKAEYLYHRFCSSPIYGTQISKVFFMRHFTEFAQVAKRSRPDIPLRLIRDRFEKGAFVIDVFPQIDALHKLLYCNEDESLNYKPKPKPTPLLIPSKDREKEKEKEREEPRSPSF